ncbi:hypothetical protein [Actinomycetospora chibensis]|uniref:CYTH domain-containing protein n=1 Tax=Actinomycetospora chibensis TaxID=663606 RepID=A0ABV9RHJ2_9PSEU|nr:hypothetical protein [Actinomycetospora chibensis]MDD7926728.1 hypothetical protein [Actinomycetospora chibensis]
MLDRARTAQGEDLPGAVGFPPPDDALWTWVAGAGVDSVELKVLLRPGPGTGTRFTVRHATRVRQRRLYLMDTPDLVLARAGVHVRLRDRGRDRWDVTVRRRGEGPVADLPRPAGARVELDVLPGHAFHSTELREVVDVDRALACRDGRLDTREVLTAAQTALLDEAAPGVATLHAHGPLAVERVTVPRPRCRLPHARHERCRFPGGRVLEEFSARCAPAEAADVARAVTRFLALHDAAPAQEQRTKSAAWLDELLRAAGV